MEVKLETFVDRLLHGSVDEVFPEEDGARCVAVVKGDVTQKEDVSVRVHSAAQLESPRVCG